MARRSAVGPVSSSGQAAAAKVAGLGRIASLLNPATLYVGLAMLAFIAYGPALHAEFVSDDINAIVENSVVTEHGQMPRIFTTSSWWSASRPGAQGYYRPLVTLTFAINHRIHGLHVFGYHLVNLLLHSLVSWLLFFLALRLGASTVAALCSCLIFLLMPLHSEAVIWAVGRAELMSAAAFATALIAILAFRSGASAWALGGAALAFAAGLLSKENAATLLAAPLIAALFLEKRPLSRDLLPFLTLATVFAAYMAMRTHLDIGLPKSHPDLLDNPLSLLDTGGRIAGAVSVLGRYLFLSVWPLPLSIDYSYDALGIGPGFVADRYSLLAVSVVSAAAWAAYRCRETTRLPAFALVLAASCYSITSNIPFSIGTIMGERLFYLPSMGLCLALGPGLGHLLQNRTMVAPVTLLLGLTLWTGVDLHRSRQWRSAVPLFQSAVHSFPGSARAHMELGTAYSTSGRPEAALQHFEAALRILPGYAAAAYNLGNMHLRAGNLEAAEQAYRRALEAEPRLERAWNNLASLYVAHRRTASAIETLEEALSQLPDSSALRDRLSQLLYMSGRFREAVQSYTILLNSGADRATVLFNRGLATRAWVGCKAAIDDLAEAAALLGDEASPQAAKAVYGNAIACLRELGRHREAEAMASRAVVANRNTRR